MIPRCPRCSYDLRAEPEAWGTSCPLDGRCPECGLEFAWVELIAPQKSSPDWWIEHPGRGRILRRGVRTAIASLQPFWFWRHLRMSSGIRPLRLALYAVLLVLVPALLFAVYRGSLAHQVRATHLAMPAWHSGIARLTIDSSWETTVTEAILHPWSPRSSITMTLSGAPGQQIRQPTRMYTAPTALAQQLDWQLKFRRVGSPPIPWIHTHEFAQETLLVNARTTLGALMVWIVVPVCFVVLPITRLRYAVHVRHLVRIWMYSLVIPCAAATVFLASAMAGRPIDIWPRGFLSSALVPLVFVIGPAFAVFWWTAMSRYLKMRHALPCALLLTLLATLVPVALASWALA